MQVTEITEERTAAREKYAEYLRAVKTRHSAEYETLKKAYRELSRGRQLIDLQATIRKGGVDEVHRPRLAIARADASHCHFWYHHENPIFSDREVYDSSIYSAASRRIKMPVDHFGIGTEAMRAFRMRPTSRLRAVMPIIPPNIKPADHLLKRYHVLWEAEWENVPPVDPYLLRRISSNIYVVIAAWDLTPLERAVLAESLQ